MPGKPVKTAKKTVEKVPKTSPEAENLPENEEKLQENAAISPENSSEMNEILKYFNELLSISALSRLFKVDRATIRTRIDNAGIMPKKIAANEKLYLLDEQLEDVIRQDELEAAKLRKLAAEAQIKEVDLKIKLEEFGSTAEFSELVQKIFGNLYKKVGVQLPKRISARLHNANSTADVQRILTDELTKEFSDLRSDFKRYL